MHPYRHRFPQTARPCQPPSSQIAHRLPHKPPPIPPVTTRPTDHEIRLTQPIAVTDLFPLPGERQLATPDYGPGAWLGLLRCEVDGVCGFPEPPVSLARVGRQCGLSFGQQVRVAIGEPGFDAEGPLLRAARDGEVCIDHAGDGQELLQRLQGRLIDEQSSSRCLSSSSGVMSPDWSCQPLIIAS